MKKKILALLMAIGMGALLIGCGNGAELENAQNQISNLRNELADLEDDYDALAHDYTTLQFEIDELQSDLEEILLENEALQSENEILQSAVDALSESNDSLQAEVEELEEEVWRLLLDLVYLGEIIEEMEATAPTPFDDLDDDRTSDPALFLGTWLWLGDPYYVFEEDGTGLKGEHEILWSVYNGILTMCTTPFTCGDNCRLPSEWDYIIEDDELILRSRQNANFIFTYARQ